MQTTAKHIKAGTPVWVRWASGDGERAVKVRELPGHRGDPRVAGTHLVKYVSDGKIGRAPDCYVTAVG
jgi:hypothetical protein